MSSEFKETDSAEASRLDSKMGFFLLLNSPSALFGVSLSFFSLVCTWAQPVGFSAWSVHLSLHTFFMSLFMVSLGCSLLDFRRQTHSPPDQLISPLLCLGRTEACLMNRLRVRSLGDVLFRLDCAIYQLHAAIQRKAESVLCRSGFSFHECV